jgi:probable phosphoglycerate mutase
MKLQLAQAEGQARLAEIAQTSESKKVEHGMRMEELASKAEYAKLISRIKISEAQSKAAASERALQAKTTATAQQAGIKTAATQAQAAAKSQAGAAAASTQDAHGATQTRKLIVIRHGTTDMNDQHKIRGWSNPPLNANGVKEAEQMARQLKSKQIAAFYTADFQRATVTAQIISRVDNIPIAEVTPGLRPWNVGSFTGMDSDKAADTLLLHATEKPDEPVAGGESFNQFKQRCLSTVMGILQKDESPVIGIVAHHRNERLISAWVAAGALPDGNVDIKVFTDWKAGCEPGCFEELEIPVGQPVMQGAANSSVPV